MNNKTNEFGYYIITTSKSIDKVIEIISKFISKNDYSIDRYDTFFIDKEDYENDEWNSIIDTYQFSIIDSNEITKQMIDEIIKQLDIDKEPYQIADMNNRKLIGCKELNGISIDEIAD